MMANVTGMVLSGQYVEITEIYIQFLPLKAPESSTTTERPEAAPAF